ncbi:SMC-Scp complex subunit ScpB [Peristeroidobacter soli]|uniref:SMC-Scp complex subunit ScpB n=1 Tax=Peristeroidobacter soli TaxID=2497877 RepID=UPI00101D15E3|nr:SMC-Scp complex subunit ScpB [Peristeroidobacter soli]
MNEHDLKHIIEATLLAAGKPITTQQLMDLFEERERPTPEFFTTAIGMLIADYENRGIELVEVASGWRIQVRPKAAEVVSRLWSERPAKYSRAFLETLALIAYRQPITRSEIEEIRGVSISSTIMRTLQERGWIRTVGHREVPGRPELLGTTREFLDYFGLKSLDQLPTLAELKDIETIGVQLELQADQPQPIEGSAEGEVAASTEEGAATTEEAAASGEAAIESGGEIVASAEGAAAAVEAGAEADAEAGIDGETVAKADDSGRDADDEDAEDTDADADAEEEEDEDDEDEDEDEEEEDEEEEDEEEEEEEEEEEDDDFGDDDDDDDAEDEDEDDDADFDDDEDDDDDFDEDDDESEDKLSADAGDSDESNDADDELSADADEGDDESGTSSPMVASDHDEEHTRVSEPPSEG